MERLITRGAEADIFLGKWGDVEAVFKIRKSKPYLVPKLDERIRRFRTVKEALNLNYAKTLGVPTPTIYYVSLKKFAIIMKYIKGVRLKETIDRKPVEAKVLGRYLGRLHVGGMAHGDPTTANLIYDKEDGRYVMIDFGLAQRTEEIEDFAIDIHLVKEMLLSIHHKIYDEAFFFFKSQYLKVVGEEFFERIMRRVKEVERRGRYARMG